MPLATQEQCIAELLALNQTSLLFERHKLRLTIHNLTSIVTDSKIFYRDKVLFKSYPNSFLIFNFEMENKNKLEMENPIHALKTDLFYHWITEFKDYSTYEKLKEKIQNRLSCASFATTLAVNWHIKKHHFSEKEISELFKGSPWRWTCLNNVWVQKTLYGKEYTFSDKRTIPYIVAVLGGDLFNNYSIDRMKPFIDFLTNKIEIIDEELAERPRELASYSTKATSYFSFKKSPKKLFNTFLGIELELDNHSPKEYTSLDILQNHAIFKRDGSVPNGVEICTTPATLDVHKEEFLPFFQSLQTNKSKLKANASCGMHVHVDKSSLSTLHIANLYQFINKEENRKKITNIAGRDPNTYCQAHVTGYDHFTSGQSGERYRMVNLQPSETIEFRLFASTTDYEDFCKKLEFVQAVVDYTRPGEMNLSVTKIPLWEHFDIYLKQYRKKYPMLSNFLYGKKPQYVSAI